MKIGIDCRLWNETGIGRYIRNLIINLIELDGKNEYVLFMQNEDCPKLKDNRENFDLMHFPYFSVPVFYNRPFVVTIPDLIVNHFPTGQASTLPGPIYNIMLLAYKFILNQEAKKAKKIIAVSKATKNEIIDHLKINPQKITVTYEGADDKISNFPTSSRSAGLRGASTILNTKYFLYVGNAYPHKNLDRLLKAFSDLRQNDTKLVLIGKEDYFYKRLKNKAQSLRLSDKVIFLQNVSDKELSNLYQNALALIMPSLMEGFGLPALEAMANNCLVLASNIPSLKEVCGDAAL